LLAMYEAGWGSAKRLVGQAADAPRRRSSLSRAARRRWREGRRWGRGGIIMGVVLITGGSRGIGAATARLAGLGGHAVAINYRAEADRAAAVVGEIEALGGTAIAVQADVAHQGQLEAVFREVERRLGRVSALVNSAGINGGPPTKVADLEQGALERLLAVNVIGTMLCCREAVRRMSTARGGQGGAIVNVSSMAATIGGRTVRSGLAASKAAVDSFTVGLAKEVAREG